LRRLHTYFWFYTGTDDSLRQQNEQFAQVLANAHVAHRYLELAGGHNWALWRGMAWRSYVTAARMLSHG
jgi:enterochelin esterase-like enzyme